MIDPDLSPAALAPLFARYGRLHIPAVLAPGGAERLLAALQRADEWTRTTVGNGNTIDLPMAALAAASVGDLAAIEAAAHREARLGFHYMYDTLRISDLVERGEPLSEELAGVYDWLNSEDFLGFMRRVSGLEDLVYVDAQATRYLPGHYLNQHDDARDGAGRRLAYVLNLTPHWRPDWGGLLGFIDEDGHIAEAYCPTFNALNLFRVPQPHMVTSVAPFAGGPRFSITGWVRSRR